MSITYDDYKNAGYKIIPGEEFARYSDMAEKTVRSFIKNFKSDNCTDDNKRGVFEIADILYSGQNQLNLKLAGFTNENYREQYFEETRLSQNEKVWEIMKIYFTREQLFRGV